MVENVLTLDQGFVSTALQPLVKDTLRAYLGDRFQLVEAKGWRSLPTSRNFHAWHADSWYDQKAVTQIPREVKLGFYLTDVRSGAFRYIRRTHRLHPPREWRTREIEAFPTEDILVVDGPAGTGFCSTRRASMASPGPCWNAVTPFFITITIRRYRSSAKTSKATDTILCCSMLPFSAI